MQSRLRFVQKRPAPRRVGRRVVSSINIRRDAVTPIELAPDSVTPEALAPNAVTADAIAPGTITNEELAPGTGGNDTSYSGSAPADPSIGDVWFDTGDSLKLKRWDGTNWVSMRDLGIAAAQAGADAASTAATAAQTTANSKNKVYRQTAEPTGGTYAEGDLWFDTDDNNKIYRRTGTAWTAVQLGGEALANINANKITAGSIDASVITVSNLDAGNLTAGTIAASRITSTSISAANITAAQITSGAISSARITSDSISAASINADNITAGRIYAADVEIGNDVGPGSGHYGVSLSSSDFNNIFIRRNDGVYFFRCGLGTANSIDFNSIGGLNIVGSITGASTVLIGNATSAGYLYINDGARMIVNGLRFQNRQHSGWDGAFYPYYDNTYDLGIGESSSGAGDAYMWQDIRYRGTLTDFSDKRMKLDIKESPLGLQFINALKPVSYRKAVRKKEAILDESGNPIRNDDDSIVYEELEGVRTHYGLIAQDVRAALESIGVDPGTFAPWRLEHLDDPDSMQSLGYIGFIAPMIKAIQELSAKVKELESNK